MLGRHFADAQVNGLALVSAGGHIRDPLPDAHFSLHNIAGLYRCNRPRPILGLDGGLRAKAIAAAAARTASATARSRCRSRVEPQDRKPIRLVRVISPRNVWALAAVVLGDGDLDLLVRDIEIDLKV